MSYIPLPISSMQLNAEPRELQPVLRILPGAATFTDGLAGLGSGAFNASLTFGGAKCNVSEDRIYF